MKVEEPLGYSISAGPIVPCALPAVDLSLMPRRSLSDLELKAGLGVAGSNTYGEFPTFIERGAQPRKTAFSH